jgi:hypothetical protein
MKTFLLRVTASLDDVAFRDLVIRALISRQSGSSIKATDLSKLSAQAFQAYATIELPEDVTEKELERWVDASFQETPHMQFVATVNLIESRRLDAEAKGPEPVILFARSNQPEPQTWDMVAGEATVVCPRCENAYVVPSDELLPDGKSDKKITCAFSCGWKSVLRLEGYGG